VTDPRTSTGARLRERQGATDLRSCLAAADT